MRATFARFLLVGAANTATGYGTTLLLFYGLGIGPIAANVVGYLLGALLSYTLNKSYTFNNDRPHAEAFPRFCLAVAACFALNLIVLEFCLTATSLPFALAQVVATCTFTTTFYLTSRLMVFRS